MTVAAALAVFAGAGFGALLRWGFALWLNPLWAVVPLGTLAANLVGGLLVGVAVAALDGWGTLAPEWRLFIVTGFLGGLTTFSTFSAEVVQMLLRQAWGSAALTATLHLAGSLALTSLGLALGTLLAARG